MAAGSGIAEPRALAEAFEVGGGGVERQGFPHAWLDTLVTVVDAERFLEDFRSIDDATIGSHVALQHGEGADEADHRYIVQLLVDQVQPTHSLHL